MAIYVTSDVHGDFNAFVNVLKKSNFSANDTLYILGDISDRGIDFYKIFTYVKNTPNIHLLRGNHEENLIRAILKMKEMGITSYDRCLAYAKFDDATRFYMMQDSITSIANERGQDNVVRVLYEEILPYLQSLPLFKIVEVNGKKFFLVHAGLNYDLPLEEQKLEHLLFSREPFNSLDLPYYDFTIVHGHTTTQILPNGGTDGEVLFRKHKISIDGGASTNIKGRLNMLRLDDMQVFYHPSPNRRIKEEEKQM